MKTLSLAFAAGLCGLAACGASAKEVREAKASGYQADFAVVYSEALAAVTERYPRLADSPRRGVIQTAWHPLNISQTTGDMGNSRQGTMQPGTQANNLGTTRAPRTFFFIRFRVRIIGGKPWRIRLVGEASKWEEGATPVRLRGADTPPWLPGRTDALRVKIHRRLEKYAVRLKTEEVKPKKQVAEVDGEAPANLASLPRPALQVVRRVQRAAATRRYDELRALLATDVVWSPGAPGDAASAMAIWQADPSLLARLAASIDAGCDAQGDRIECGIGTADRALFSRRPEGWRLSEFVPEG